MFDVAQSAISASSIFASVNSVVNDPGLARRKYPSQDGAVPYSFCSTNSDPQQRLIRRIRERLTGVGMALVFGRAKPRILGRRSCARMS